MGVVIKTDGVDWRKLFFEGNEVEGVRLKMFCGNRIMVGLIEMEPDCLSHESHKHEEEQLGFVLQGKREFYWIDQDGEKSEVIEKGSLYIIGPNELHGTRPLGGEKFIVLEIWSPPPQRFMEMAIKARK
jgi:mannose-6-phosphate isomerase-like protein (cupin superfamily)